MATLNLKNPVQIDPLKLRAGIFLRTGAVALSVSALSANAQDLMLPGTATLAYEEAESATAYSLAVSPWLGTGAEMISAQGALARRVWQIEAFEGNSAQLMALLREQLEAQSYVPVFACDTTLCGGFDFRFAMDVTPEPDMHVDLGDFSYFVAQAETEEGLDYVAILTSRGGQKGYVHMVRVSPAEMGPLTVELATRSPMASQIDTGDFRTNLEANGTATLFDLQFDTGSSSLSDQDYPSLVDLAEFLADNPDLHVALVGHTDAEGALDNNIALSRARADAVRSYLIDQLGTEPVQLEAEGVGYLAPVANNSSTEGRQQNRRVEVVITSTR